MKRNRMIALTFAAMILASGGCASRPVVESDYAVAMAVLGPAEITPTVGPGEFHLGAGDMLGQAVFHKYVAFVRANSMDPNWQYADGQAGDPMLDQ